MHRYPTIPIALITLAIGLAVGPAHVADRTTKVLDDRTTVQETGLWHYNDLDAGIAEAKRTRKPLLVIFRCVP